MLFLRGVCYVSFEVATQDGSIVFLSFINIICNDLFVSKYG